MPRILGLDLPKEKRIEISLTYFYGIGRTLANKILKDVNVDPNKRAKDLSEEEISRIASMVQKNYRIEGDLKREIAQNVKRLIDIGSYRGSRHRRGLPVRGQRTKTNARTRKGKKKNVGIMKAAVEKPAAA
ncbi:MAG: 30S ribosomal protein S13 [Candidatus Omnitrophica bacterium]|nr:30S ribosomal protein S13 [Candidatus Omnitrophota bacterium]